MRSKIDKIRDNRDHPLCLALGTYHQFLNSDQAASSTPNERIRSVWPYICSKAREFTATLTPRERANFDEEDVITEIWVYIRERDHKWTKERGQYISFVVPLVHNCLYGLREVTRTIESATNTCSRLKSFDKEAKKGELSDSKRKTMESMQRSVAGPEKLTDIVIKNDSPDSEIIAEEEHREIVLAVVDIVRHISYEEASIIGPHLGLWGQSQRSFGEIACKLGKSCSSVKKTYIMAIERLSSKKK